MWATEVWQSIIWSDECRFQRVPDTPFRVWRQRGFCAAVAQGCTQPQVQSGGGSLMVWGAFSADGIKVLVRIPNTITAQSYIETLKTHLLPKIPKSRATVRGALLRQKHKFQQDNAPPHVAGDTKRFLADLGIRTSSVIETPWIK